MWNCQACEDNEDYGDMRGCPRHRDTETAVRDVADHEELAWSRYAPESD